MINGQKLFSTTCQPVCFFPGSARRLIIAAAGIMLFQTPLLPQAARTGQDLLFEVPSIKPSTANEPRYYGFLHVGDRQVSGECVNISVWQGWIQIAWGVTGSGNDRGPMDFVRRIFDLDAEGGTPRSFGWRRVSDVAR